MAMFVLTITINSIAVILLLNKRNPLITILVASVFLITPTIIAQIIEGYMQITVEDERREFIIKDASRMAVNQFIIVAILGGALLIIIALITEGEGLSTKALNAVSIGGITLLTIGLLIAWIFAFSMDVQRKFKTEVYPKVNLSDLILAIVSSFVIFLYMNHYAVLVSGGENSVVSSIMDSEKNWFSLFFIFSTLNIFVYKIYITKFGPEDEMQKTQEGTASIFTLKLGTLVLLTISLLLIIMYLIQADQDLLELGIPTFLSFILLRSGFLLNINRAASQFS